MPDIHVHVTLEAVKLDPDKAYVAILKGVDLTQQQTAQVARALDQFGVKLVLNLPDSADLIVYEAADEATKNSLVKDIARRLAQQTTVSMRQGGLGLSLRTANYADAHKSSLEEPSR